MSALANSFISAKNHEAQFLSGSVLRRVDKNHSQCKLIISPASHGKAKSNCRRALSVQAAGDSGRSSSAGLFVGGFVLGGIVVGALGCVYAPQISKVLAGTDRKDLMRKLPKFIYDEEKALEKTRKVLTEKIAQLNAAIDDVSSQLRTDDGPNGAAVAPDELEASI